MAYGFQSIHFNQNNAPQLEPIIATKSFVFWGFNIATLGIYGAASTLSKQYSIKELKLKQKDLEVKAAELLNNWNKLEKKFIRILRELKSLDLSSDEDVKSIKKKFSKFSLQKDRIQEQSIQAHLKVATTLAGAALGTITLIGHLIANILTVGIYGVYQNYNLKNRITVLEAQNKSIQDQFEEQKEQKFQYLEKMTEYFNEYLALAEENGNIRQTDAGKAYLAVQQAKDDLKDLNKQHQDLQTELAALKTDKEAVERAYEEAENTIVENNLLIDNLNARVKDLQDEQWDLKQQRDLSNDDNANLKKEVANLQVQFNKANAKSDRVKNLEKEIERLQATQKGQPEIIKLASQLGPIPPKYTPTDKDGLVQGAMDIDEIEDLDDDQAEFFQEYNKRYGSKGTANQIIQTGFAYSFDQLIKMAANGDKIKFNNSAQSVGQVGESVVFRYMVLDLLKGAKVDENGCHGFKLQINGDVSMLPSQPELTLQYKDDQAGGMKPVVKLHYTQRDDFTPDEDVLRTRDGVNPVAAKWILEQLSAEEQQHLFTHLMEPVIENKHPDYQKMRAFIKKRATNSRAQLVDLASTLIQDMADAMMKKSTGALQRMCWSNVDADFEVEPFVKEEDDISKLKDVADLGIAQIKNDENIIDWKIDPDVLGDKRAADNKPRQPEFYDMIALAQHQYKQIFANLTAGLLLSPRKKNEKIDKLDWKTVDAQYYVCHQMIGTDAAREFKGGERCLFSNLLAVLVTKEEDLTVENVQKLKKAMAAYLEKLQNIAVEWSFEMQKPIFKQSKDAPKLKEMAELAKAFEEAIQSTHGCTLMEYQNWLRNGPGGFGSANIDINNLTPFEIQLVAYTMGIRIGLLPINMQTQVVKKDKKGQVSKETLAPAAEADEYGRILPINEFYGPNTEEVLIMGINDPLNGKGGSYYGLFPKLNLDPEKLQGDADLFESALELNNYWMNIDVNTKKT